VAALLAISFFFPACSDDSGDRVRTLRDIRRSGRLVVLTRNSPTTYYEDRDGFLAGLEYDMVQSFASWLGVEAEFRVIDSVAGLLDTLAAGGADLAAAGLTYTEGRSRDYLVGPVYQTVTQLVIARRGSARPRTVHALESLDLRVVAGSSYDERLRALGAEHPGLTWVADDTLGAEQLLEMVWNRRLDCTIVDNNIFAINRRYFPELIASMAIQDPEPLAWFLNLASRPLRAEIHDWFEQFNDSGELNRLIEKYYGFVEIYDYVDTREFRNRIRNRLPDYRPMFERAAADYGLPWTLLAAQSYQESHWNPRAQSPTGVKGIMMLTLAASEDLAVTDRLDAAQSIDGGARYLRQLADRLPSSIRQPDRTWIALAAYNVGMAHLYDARELARRLDKNPDLWRDLREVLPLLAQKQYYETLDHGYARGSEPVQFVNRVRNYEDILKRTVD
jgi:membrane-bound lytic murein transglycosylase F